MKIEPVATLEDLRRQTAAMRAALAYAPHVARRERFDPAEVEELMGAVILWRQLLTTRRDEFIYWPISDGGAMWLRLQEVHETHTGHLMGYLHTTTDIEWAASAMMANVRPVAAAVGTYLGSSWSGSYSYVNHLVADDDMKPYAYLYLKRELKHEAPIPLLSAEAPAYGQGHLTSYELHFSEPVRELRRYLEAAFALVGGVPVMHGHRSRLLPDEREPKFWWRLHVMT